MSLNERDFTIKIYQILLKKLIFYGYYFMTYKEYLTKRKSYDLPDKFIILRHDVDRKPKQSHLFASIQHKMSIKGTYYFRIVPQSLDLEIVSSISDKNHEIGYHYETMDTSKGDLDLAYKEFLENLGYLRSVTRIDTISMHGSPLSKYDNRDVWKKHDYKRLGILGEPYFELDFNDVFYITDTGRRWDGHKYNVRDKAPIDNPITNIDFLKRKYRSTMEIIEALENETFPNRVMMNFHPERWTDDKLLWLKDAFIQLFKNQIKRLILLVRG